MTKEPKALMINIENGKYGFLIIRVKAYLKIAPKIEPSPTRIKFIII